MLTNNVIRFCSKEEAWWSNMAWKDYFKGPEYRANMSRLEAERQDLRLKFEGDHQVATGSLSGIGSKGHGKRTPGLGADSKSDSG